MCKHVSKQSNRETLLKRLEFSQFKKKLNRNRVDPDKGKSIANTVVASFPS